MSKTKAENINSLLLVAAFCMAREGFTGLVGSVAILVVIWLFNDSWKHFVQD